MKLTVRVVEGDKVEISDDSPLFPHSWVLSAAEAEYLSYDLLDAAEEAAAYGREPTDAQMEAMNNPDSGPVRTEDSPAYRAQMQDAGRGGFLR